MDHHPLTIKPTAKARSPETRKTSGFKFSSHYYLFDTQVHQHVHIHTASRSHSRFHSGYNCNIPILLILLSERFSIRRPKDVSRVLGKGYLT